MKWLKKLFGLKKKKDKPTSIRTSNITVTSGFQCQDCGLVRPWSMDKCICKNYKD